ncbi:hypothetical protein DV515_00014200 [Chloebia gouldiae]|uniref:Uncharacterized protein n=1 Tax=Chloebia gouldiae TaxID=44316 RepID=A0A3L8RZ51_CHLGU|nr:hypothetical protein DV515_00014200 [Chloebia gouldiae]
MEVTREEVGTEVTRQERWARRGSARSAAGGHPALRPGKPFGHRVPRDKHPEGPVPERGRQRGAGDGPLVPQGVIARASVYLHHSPDRHVA